jgi:hypothetical protein
MTAKQFIQKWNISYEDKWLQSASVNQMKADLAAVVESLEITDDEKTIAYTSYVNTPDYQNNNSHGDFMAGMKAYRELLKSKL